MTAKQAITWFKRNFVETLKAAAKNKVYDANLLIAIAYQETGYLWQKKITDINAPLTPTQLSAVLEISVGDTIDWPKREHAFPKNKADLLSAKQGDAMFSIARAALEKVAPLDQGYKEALKNPNKFCHGYGVFQYDLQFFITGDANFFLQKKWTDLNECVIRFVKELDDKVKRVFPHEKNPLSHDNQVYLAIAYNQGHVDLAGGFAQGHKDQGEPYYGQKIDTFLSIAEKA